MGLELSTFPMQSVDREHYATINTSRSKGLVSENILWQYYIVHITSGAHINGRQLQLMTFPQLTVSVQSGAYYSTRNTITLGETVTGSG